jgi:hypothetical protein
MGQRLLQQCSIAERVTKSGLQSGDIHRHRWQLVRSFLRDSMGGTATIIDQQIRWSD